MKKIISLTLAAALFLTVLASCRMPEKHDPFKEILEENPDMELPKSEIMEVDPENIQDYDIEDTVENYENEFETEGGEFFCKDRKYSYNGSDLILIYLENRTVDQYAVSIHAEYLDENGTLIREETQVFEGFPSYWQNYFVFLPNMTFASYMYTLEFEKWEGESPISPELIAYPSEPSETKLPMMERVTAFHDFEKYPTIKCDFHIQNMPSVPLSMYCILFDELGEIYFLEPYLLHVKPEEKREYGYITKILLQTMDSEIVWPVEISDSVGGVVAISRENIFGEEFDDEFAK